MPTICSHASTPADQNYGLTCRNGWLRGSIGLSFGKLEGPFVKAAGGGVTLPGERET